jgi:hypothetical protein
MTDEIRKRTAPKNQDPEWRRLEDEDCSFGDEWPGTDSTLSWPVAKPKYSNRSTLLTFLEPREERLSESLGEVGYEVLLSHFDIYPEGYGGTNQKCESALTQAIARRRMVSPQQARADKRRFRERMHELRPGNRDILDLYSRLDRGDDDNTLRIEWVWGNGRKSSFKMSISPSLSNNDTDKEYQSV